MRVVNRDPRTAPHRTRNDALLAVATAALATAIALVGSNGPRPDALGWTLLLAAHAPSHGGAAVRCRSCSRWWPASSRTTPSTTTTPRPSP